MSATTDQEVEAAASAAIESYRAVRTAYLELQDRADAAWNRWFTKRMAGEKTNGSAAMRLANLANYASADLAGAEFPLWRLEIDPRLIDESDGIKPGRIPVSG